MRSIGSATYSGWTAVALVVSLGVAIQNAHHRLNTELLGFLMGTTVEGRVPPAPIERVWWKVGHVFGTAQPVLDGVSAAEQLALSKAFFDVMWSVTLEEILTDTLSVDDPAHREFARSAAHHDVQQGSRVAGHVVRGADARLHRSDELQHLHTELGLARPVENLFPAASKPSTASLHTSPPV
jgi:hypothetical protein